MGSSHRKTNGIPKGTEKRLVVAKEEGKVVPSSSRPHHAVSPSSSQHRSSSAQVHDSSSEMRIAVRRKQNNESAKRCRERRKVEEKELQNQCRENSVLIQQLETHVQNLEAVLTEKRRTKGKRVNTAQKKKGESSSSSTGEYFEPHQRFFGDPF